MEINEEVETIINKEFDYSNIIPTADNISVLVQYCEGAYKGLLKLIEEDEQKNERFKLEYKNYNYGKHYSVNFEVVIHGKHYNNIVCNNYNAYIQCVNNGQLNNLESLKITVNLSYKRGLGNNLKSHENSFIISFKPYEIIFTRKSNYNEEDMNQIENAINNILQQFPKVNSIFCAK